MDELYMFGGVTDPPEQESGIIFLISLTVCP